MSTKEELALIRKAAIERDLKKLPGFWDYLKESIRLPKWRCQKCGLGKIPCSQSTCPQCNDMPRPKDISDPEFDNVATIGKHRRKAGIR